MISIRGSLWFATTRVVCNQGDGEPIEWAIKKNGAAIYKGNDSLIFLLLLFLIDLILFNGHITAGFLKSFVISAAHVAKNPTMVSETGSIGRINRLKNRLRYKNIKFWKF